VEQQVLQVMEPLQEALEHQVLYMFFVDLRLKGD
jgi:hypothetical protein